MYFFLLLLLSGLYENIKASLYKKSYQEVGQLMVYHNFAFPM